MMRKEKSQLSAVLLCGGKSRRFGSEKGLACFRGVPLAERIITALSQISDDILISTNQPDLYRPLGRPLVEDIYPGFGPISGIHAALSKSRCKYLAVCACDMPFVSPELFLYLMTVIGAKDLAIPISPQSSIKQDGRNRLFYEPLHAIYGQSCYSIFDQAIKAGTHKITSTFDKLEVRAVPEDEWRVVPGVASGIFQNVNTKDDLSTIENGDIDN